MTNVIESPCFHCNSLDCEHMGPSARCAIVTQIMFGLMYIAWVNGGTFVLLQKFIDLPVWDPFLTYDINALALTSCSLIVFEAHSVFKRLRAIICDHMGPSHTFLEQENTRVHTKQVDKLYI